MKKQQLFSVIALGTVLAGCTSDELINKTALENAINADGRITFAQKTNNMTRANTRAELAGHYEFGVWGYKGAAANKRYTEGDVMTDYLVAYGDNTTGSTNYKGLSANATTYGVDAKEDETTVAPDGISTWYYEGLGNAEGSHKERTSPDAHIVPLATLQGLKYWDKSTAFTNFFAYMPYYGTANANGQSVEIEDVNDATPDLTFNNAGIFVTDPVVQGTTEQQPALNKEWANAYTLMTRDFYNSEITNANEANYAAVSRAKADYEKDVPLNFHHVNAKIKVAIWEAIPGYKVELIDLINNKVVTDNASISETYKGVAFTPATKTQAIEHQNHNQLATPTPVVTPSGSTPLPAYVTAGNVVAADVTPDTRSVLSYVTSSTTESNVNLRYTIESDDAIPYEFREATPGTPTHNRISEVGGKSATVLNTTYYMMPNVALGSTVASPAWITENYSEGYTSQQIGSVTGYTFHVSYRLLPEDGSAPTEVYDARVWVAPEYCRWLDGKQYTYIFKITTSSNGVTDPNAVSKDIFVGSTETDPYIDPEDPRIPDDPALVPIVFDGITIEDYEAIGTGHNAGEPDTWQISNVESWPSHIITVGGAASAIYDYRFCNYLTTADVYSGAINLSNEYYKTIVTAPTVAAGSPNTDVVFVGGDADPATPDYVFQYGANFKAVTSGTQDYNYTALASGSTTWNDVVDFSSSTPISILTTAKSEWNANIGNKDFATYKMYIWNSDAATAAWEYTATPNADDITIKTTLNKEVVDQTYNNRAYRIIKTYNAHLSVVETKYYKAGSTPGTWDEISATTYGAVTPVPAIVNTQTEYFGTKTWKKITVCDVEGNPTGAVSYEFWDGAAWLPKTESEFTTAGPSADGITVPGDKIAKAYTFSYEYSIARTGYTVTKTNDAATPKQAYGIVKK